MNKTIRNLIKHFPATMYLCNFDFNNDVLNYLPLADLDEIETTKCLDHILSLMSEQTLVGNKFIYNLNKISVDSLDKSTNQISREYEFMYLHDYHENELKIRKKLNYEKQRYRFIIRKSPFEAQSIIDWFSEETGNLKTENNLSNLTDIVDLSSDIILQAVNYWVITTNDVSKCKKIILGNIIYKYLLDLQNCVMKEPVKTQYDLVERMKIFVSFLDCRNIFGEYIKILDELKSEEIDDKEFFGEIPEKYQLNKKSVIQPKDIMKIILEGGEIYQFKLKYNDTKEAIKIFEKYGGRVASIENALDQKVYFRELYISSSKYKIKASTIIKNMLDCYRTSEKPEYKKLSEYMFLREKITRGYFREADQLDLYHLKNRIQEQLYKTLITIILCYDYEKSLGYLNEMVNDLIPICFSEIDSILEAAGTDRIF